MNLQLPRSIPLFPLFIVAAIGLGSPTLAAAEEHSLDGVNFMGPLITANPAALPQGNWYIEPYLVRVDSDASYDGDGKRHDRAARSGAWLTVVPISYGFSKRLTGQITPRAARAESDGRHSGGFRIGSTAAKLQYQLQAPNADGTRPAVSISLSQHFATGRHDRIEGNPLDAQGDGVRRTSLGLGVQQIVWMPNGRPLRWRSNLSYSPGAPRVELRDQSVYGTAEGFRGGIARGSLAGVSAAMEYSFNPRWVGVMEFSTSRESAQHLSGYAPDAAGVLQQVDERRPASRSVTLAPAVEYHFNSRVGVIAGVEFSVAGRNSGDFISPQVALGMFF